MIFAAFSNRVIQWLLLNKIQLLILALKACKSLSQYFAAFFIVLILRLLKPFPYAVAITDRNLRFSPINKLAYMKLLKSLSCLICPRPQTC